jgi:dUTP pyrophosphatase
MRRHIPIQVERLPEGEGLPLPEYQTAGAAGMDLHAAVDGETVIAPGSWALIPTGLRIAVPAGYEAQVRPRSGLALRCGVTVLNAPGTIDSDYRGPVGVILHNAGSEPFVVRRGDRIAQMIVAPVCRALLTEVAAGTVPAFGTKTGTVPEVAGATSPDEAGLRGPRRRDSPRGDSQAATVAARDRPPRSRGGFGHTGS